MASFVCPFYQTNEMETLLIREQMKRTYGKSFNEPTLIDGMLVSWLPTFS